MKKIMFNDGLGLTTDVLMGWKTQTRRIIKDGTPIDNLKETLKSASYKIGEVVAVAQNYQDAGVAAENEAGWNNKMFVKAWLMPHRIRITNIRVEHLQDISDEDCMKEGICKTFIRGGGFWCYTTKASNMLFHTPQEAYAALIDKVCKKGTWDKNPLVLVYEFRLLK